MDAGRIFSCGRLQVKHLQYISSQTFEAEMAISKETRGKVRLVQMLRSLAEAVMESTS